MKIAICEDEALWRTQLERVVRRWAEERKEKLELAGFCSSESFWFAFLQEKDWDVLLLDIEMGQENGMELAERIRREDEDTAIIFTTGYADYMAKGYDVGAMQYLLKPIEEQKLFACLDRVARRQSKEEQKLFFMTTEQVRISVAPSRIWYAEAVGHNCQLHTGEGRFEVRMGITEVEKVLGSREDFLRCHRSYLVNLRFIREIRRSTITLDDGQLLPVSRSAYPGVSEAFMRFYAGREPSCNGF